MAQKWSAAFYQYYCNHIAPDITSIARWAIEPLVVYSPFSGVTNNQAEGLNYVLKQLVEWREAPIDCMALALYNLQGYYNIEISRGKRNLGNYNLHSRFSSIAAMEAELPFNSDHQIYHPKEIVQRIKGKCTMANVGVSESMSDKKEDRCLEQLTQKERARCVVEQRKISLDSNLRTFTVMGTNKPHVVTLHPKESCSCASSTSCYHILAAKLSIGVTCEAVPKTKLSLTQLRKNSRSSKEKKSGRKRPRPGDYEVCPAPDASGSELQAQT